MYLLLGSVILMLYICFMFAIYQVIILQCLKSSGYNILEITV